MKGAYATDKVTIFQQISAETQAGRLRGVCCEYAPVPYRLLPAKKPRGNGGGGGVGLSRGHLAKGSIYPMPVS